MFHPEILILFNFEKVILLIIALQGLIGVRKIVLKTKFIFLPCAKVDDSQKCIVSCFAVFLVYQLYLSFQQGCCASSYFTKFQYFGQKFRMTSEDNIVAFNSITPT